MRGAVILDSEGDTYFALDKDNRRHNYGIYVPVSVLGPNLEPGTIFFYEPPMDYQKILEFTPTSARLPAPSRSWLELLPRRLVSLVTGSP